MKEDQPAPIAAFNVQCHADFVLGKSEEIWQNIYITKKSG